jgi:hypothetical protein
MPDPSLIAKLELQLAQVKVARESLPNDLSLQLQEQTLKRVLENITQGHPPRFKSDQGGYTGNAGKYIPPGE